MNRDVEDALLSIHERLHQIANELDALTTQYKLDLEEAACIEQVTINVGNAVREIQRYVP